MAVRHPDTSFTPSMAVNTSARSALVFLDVEEQGCSELEDPWAVIRICSAVSVSEPTKILRHAYTLNAFALMSPESYQQTRPRSCFRTCRLHLDRCHDPASIRCLRSAPSKPPVARSGEDSALILPEVSSASRHRQMEVRHVSAFK